MGFDKFGIVGFTAFTKTSQFVELLRQNVCSGTVCMLCGTRYFPPRSDCHVCLSQDMEWFPISGEGALLTFTKVTFAPAGFEKELPYSLGVAGFDHEIKVFGRIDKSVPDEMVKIGMKVKIRVANLSDDRVIYEFTGTGPADCRDSETVGSELE